MRLPICGMLVFVALVAAGPAFGASAADWEQCKDVNNKNTADRSLAACNRILKDRSEAKYHPLVLRNRCGIYYTKGDYEHALADCNEAWRREPQSAIVYNRRGLIWSAKGDKVRAIADYDQAILLDPKYALAYYNRGLAKREKADTAGGDADIARAKQLQPDIEK
jgi:tetratricopeptide (TPR) repeat protein